MKKITTAVIGLMIAASAAKVQAQPYFETQAGVFLGDQMAALYGSRVGVEVSDMFEGSVGYWGAPGDTTLHTINAELCELFPVTRWTTVKGIFDVGYTMPDLPGSEKGDNGISWAFGAGLDHAITGGATLGLSLKWFLFRTDTHSTVYGSHPETLNTGQVVEVLDTAHCNDSRLFNAVLLAVSLRW